MRLPSLRLRLTLIATAVCVVAVGLGGLVAHQQLEQSLIESAFDSAESALDDALFADAATVSQADSPGGVTRFDFVDAEGSSVGPAEFTAMIDRALARELLESGFFVELPLSATELSPDFATTVESGAIGFTLEDPVQRAGETDRRVTADELIIDQAVVIGDEALTVSVITPRQPLNDSLGAFTNFLVAMVAVLAVLVATATWLVSSRVLRPVEAIRRQVEETNADRLDHHVPRSGNGDEIDRLAGTMNDMLDRLRRASDEQRRFVSDASHELRSPITATLATLETTTEEDAAERWNEVRSVLATEQGRLTQLVDDLLLLASMDEAGSQQRHDIVDLDELLLAESRRSHPRPVKVRISAPQRVEGSASMLRRCVANLVENAARHARSSVQLTLDAYADGSAVIWVDDDGPGVPAGQTEAIFERFTRIDDARNRREGGAGLGLAIAREIAEFHGGTLTATDRQGGGARFELVIPAPTTP